MSASAPTICVFCRITFLLYSSIERVIIASDFKYVAPMKFADSKLVFWLFAILVCPSTRAQVTQTVAFSGDLAPGISPDTSFASFLAPAFNNDGIVAFQGTLKRRANETPTQHIATRSGIWTGTKLGLRLVARTGDLYRNFGTPALTDSGKIAFQSRLSGSVDSTWLDSNGVLTLVAREGNTAPGTSKSFYRVWAPILNDSGQFAFAADLVGNDEGIWVQRDGPVHLLVKRDWAAPGLAGGKRFFSFLGPGVGTSGEVAFAAALYSDTEGPRFYDSVWVERNGSLNILAQAGDHSPGALADVTFRNFGPVFRRAEQVAFFADLQMGLDWVGNGIWIDKNTSLVPIALYGDPAPGTPADVTFSQLFNSFALNDAGDIAFKTFFSGPGVANTNHTGVYTHVNNTLRLIARQGDQAPGTPNGVLFNELRPNFQLNNAGQIAFVAKLTGTGVTNGRDTNGLPSVPNDLGIWANDRSGVLRLVARVGDLMDVDDGPIVDLRQIQTLNFYQGFNDSGQLAFSAIFTDGSSGVFISNIVAIPEPSHLSLLVFYQATLLIVSRRRRWSC